MSEKAEQTTLIDLPQQFQDLLLQYEDLKLKHLQKEQDLDDTLYVIYCVLNLIGLNFENIRDAQLKQVIKGLNKMIFKATSAPEEFQEDFQGFFKLAIKIAEKYEDRTKQIVAQRTA